MNVKELTEKLQAVPPDSEVIASTEQGRFGIRLVAAVREPSSHGWTIALWLGDAPA